MLPPFLALHQDIAPMAPCKKNKDASSVPRASWNSTDDATLLECLIKQKENGRMTSNSSWHSAAWVDAKKVLAGLELLRGGGPKLADSCHNRWTSLKKDYVAVRDLRAMLGFGWDDALSIVIAPDDVWDRLIAIGHPNLVAKSTYKKWRKSAFPLYDDMHCLVVGTIATGDMAFHPGRNFTPNGSEATADASQPIDESQPDSSESQATVMIDWPESPQRRSPTLPEENEPEEALPTLMVPKTPAPSASRKRHAADDAVLARLSVQGLAEALAKPDPLTTPERRTAAISIIEKEAAFSDRSRNKVFKLICRDIAFAESITSIQDAQKRVGYIRSELEDL
ncbi:hypothetical protein B0H34DRAFT_860492 [Crassisporium funariophilum]|nr:hypothetical protein B0H34DRAFT_860492 [Crassisporium funariophilum]